MSDCIFCAIASKKSPANIEIETDNVIAFHDLHKDAPVHILVVPKKHFESLNDIKDSDGLIIGELFLVAKQVAEKLNIAKSGYRCIINTNQDAGQVVKHIHLHLLGGKPLGPLVQKDLK